MENGTTLVSVKLSFAAALSYFGKVKTTEEQSSPSGLLLSPDSAA